MAKETKNAKNAVPTAPVKDEELEKVLNNQALTEVQSNNMIELIKKEHDENAQKQVKMRIEKAIYRVEEGVLQRKKDRRIADEISLYKTRQLTRMVRFLAGGVVDDNTIEFAQTPDNIWERETLDKEAESITLVIDKASGEKKTFKKGENLPAIIDPVDFDEMYSQLDKELRKRREAIEEEYSRLLKKLELRHGEYYDRSWRW